MSTDSIDGLEVVKQTLPIARTCLVENRGRDILPFLHVYRRIAPIGYAAVLKIHSKKSLRLTDEQGKHVRDCLFSSLFNTPYTAAAYIQAFRQNKKLGIMCPQNFLTQQTEENTKDNIVELDNLSSLLNIPPTNTPFTEGSMFWFRPKALAPLLKIKDTLFPLEMGQNDGTIGHGIERFFTITAQHEGYRIETCEQHQQNNSKADTA